MMVYSISTLLLLIPASLSHWDSAYFRNPTDGFTSKNNCKLSELSIPGTQDSGCYDSRVTEAARTHTFKFSRTA